jgi:hypothetical protein
VRDDAESSAQAATPAATSAVVPRTSHHFVISASSTQVKGRFPNLMESRTALL